MKAVLISSILIFDFFLTINSALPVENHQDFPGKKFLWPIKSEKISEKLSSLFGESRGDHFHNGLDLSSANEEVRSIAAGKIVYYKYSEDFPFENETGAGNSIWLSHGESILSAYYHLKDGKIKSLSVKNSVDQNEKIGISGNTGHSSGSHLHFVIATENGKKIINPLKILPPVQDFISPEIGGLTITVGDKFTNINDGDYINVSKNYPITVVVFDKGEKSGQRRGIRDIAFTFNGKPVKESKFSEISLLRGNWVSDDGLPYDELFFNDNYLVGDLPLKSGENIISVAVSDFHGNTANKMFTFYVNRITSK
ncbi:MAG: M23 family metallopeptidase [Leptospira sp.]|nr:M23 family metallopeptidase [Leptospira sp.]